MMKKPGFSRAKAKPFKQGPLTTVASVMEARSLKSPALKATVVAAAALSGSYLALNDAFIIFDEFDESVGFAPFFLVGFVSCLTTVIREEGTSIIARGSIVFGIAESSTSLVRLTALR